MHNETPYSECKSENVNLRETLRDPPPIRELTRKFLILEFAITAKIKAEN